MLAPQLALYRLFFLGVVPIASALAADPDLQLYLKTGDIVASVRGEMKYQTEIIMQDAGFDVGWWDSREELRDTRAHLLVIEFRGSCAPASRKASGHTLQSFSNLASSAVTDGRVLPFIRIDCDELNNLLRSKFGSEPQLRQASLYARALARVLAHEIYHVIGQTTLHTRNGLTKSRVRAEELIDENFGFTEPAIEKLHAPHTDPAMSGSVLVAGCS
jgi:hypothetical protein